MGEIARQRDSFGLDEALQATFYSRAYPLAAAQLAPLCASTRSRVEPFGKIARNLNTHKLGSLYQAFAPETARRLAQRLEIHYTPKHGSWLNIAELELSVLTRQCLDRRIPDLDTLCRETHAWETWRNTAQKSVDWRFTTPDARIKLRRFYPQIQT